MKKYIPFLALFFALLAVNSESQTFSPVNTASYNLDAVAENTTALATTGGAIDGSNFVMYSVAYGALYSVSTGLPNNGLISTPTSTYQLQPYTANNVLYVTTGLIDSVTVVTPASYAGLSLLGFATEGNGTFNATVRFTDNSTQVFPALTFFDWFGGSSPIYSGFDRVSRSTGVPANSSGNPRLFSIELALTCANRLKQVKRILIQNTGTNPRICLMAVSAANTPSYSAAAFPVTCSGGTNGSASITATGGMLPYSYTWTTTPPQLTASANNLPVGTYTYLVQDNGGCIVTSTVAVTLSLAVQPSLNVSSNTYTICSGGSFTLGVSGASTYTWVGGNNSSIYSPGTQTATALTLLNYSVAGITTANCYRTGSVTITVNPKPGASFTGPVGPLCNNSSPLALAPLVQQSGGAFSGPGVVSGSFNPAFYGVGTYTITFTNTDANNCTNSATTSVQVFSLAVPQITPPNALCSNGNTVQVNANPGGGTFSGIPINPQGVITPSLSGAGTYTLGYTLVSGPCTSNVLTNVIINAAPTASFVNPKTFFCKTASSTFFNTNPSGGTFSGPGMSGPAFNPAQANIGNTNIIIYTFTDMNGCSDTASLRVTVSACTGIGQINEKSLSLAIYPNPNSGSFEISANQELSLVLVNQLGELIQCITLSESTNFLRKITDLVPGVYFLMDKGVGGAMAKKIVVSN
ncbi:MAG: T9SS type A sorting domain-containing protein [bacterium]|nr:T9SS type A sorting domain-containing protein [bacterium]